MTGILEVCSGIILLLDTIVVFYWGYNKLPQTVLEQDKMDILLFWRSEVWNGFAGQTPGF